MKVLIADDNALSRDALNLRLVQLMPDVSVISADSYAKTIELLSGFASFDIIVINLDMQQMAGENALNSILQAAENSKIVIISSSEDSAKIRKLFALGIKGYIPKNSDAKIFGYALQLVAAGGKYLPPSLVETPYQTKTAALDNSQIRKPLTNRQFQVLDLVAQGKSNKQIAYDMGVSEATVKLHINALLRSLHVTNRTQAVITAQKMGLI